MNNQRRLLVSLSTVAVLGAASVVHAQCPSPTRQTQRHTYIPRFVTGISQFASSAQEFHSEAVRHLRPSGRGNGYGYGYGQGRGHASHACTSRELLAKASETAELSARISESVRRGASPWRIQGDARRLEACVDDVDRLIRANRSTHHHLQNKWAQMRTLFTSVERGFQRNLYAHNQPATPTHPGGHAPRGGWQTGGYRPGHGSSASGSYQDFVRYLYSRMSNRY